jgi:hypothetical protein
VPRSGIASATPKAPLTWEGRPRTLRGTPTDPHETTADPHETTQEPETPKRHLTTHRSVILWRETDLVNGKVIRRVHITLDATTVTETILTQWDAIAVAEAILAAAR